MTGNNYAAKIDTMNPIDYDSPTGWLLCGLKLNKSTEDINTLKNLSDGDWDATLQLAIHHGVAPYLYQHLASLEPDLSINSDTFKKLHQIYLASFARNTRLYHHLSEILTKLQRKNIPVIALKGIHLAEIVYQDIALRPMDDIDLLVKQNDLAEATQTLQLLGYDPPRDFWIDIVQKEHNDLPTFSKFQGTFVDLHWNIEAPNSPFIIDPENLWQRAKPTTVAGVDVLALSPEDMLLHLCLHTAYRDKFDKGLRPFCDILEMVNHFQDELDWSQVAVLAKKWKASKTVYVTLYFAKQLLAAPIPKEVLVNLVPSNLDADIMIWAENQILTKPGLTQHLNNLTDVWRAQRLSDKLTILLKRIFLPRNIMATMYGVHPSSKKIYLYYPVRLRDLLYRYANVVWRLFRRESKAITNLEQESKGNIVREWLTLE